MVLASCVEAGFYVRISHVEIDPSYYRFDDLSFELMDLHCLGGTQPFCTY